MFEPNTNLARLHRFCTRNENVDFGGLSLGPRPSRDSTTEEGLVSNVHFLACAESACEHELCILT